MQHAHDGHPVGARLVEHQVVALDQLREALSHQSSAGRLPSGGLDPRDQVAEG
jgi:N-acetylglucosamine kinase-like BadF-type ATPase